MGIISIDGWIEPLANDLLRHLDLSKCVGRSKIGGQLDLHKRNPSPFFIKVLPECVAFCLFTKAAFPRSPFPAKLLKSQQAPQPVQ